MPSFTTTLLLLTVLLVVLPSQVAAFGAGDIPDWGYLESKAFRHGDIEAVLVECLKSIASSGDHGGGLLGFATSIIKQASGGSKFTKNDVKKVYFGNWLRDYSQCMDIAGLSKLSADTLVLVVQILGFMAFGYATEEFEVTADRLGVYLCTEHIDNPKGYASTEENGDARKYHPKLRPPVENVELEIDESNGMKKYMATEGQSFDTSTGLLRRTFKECIELGRRVKGKESAELWEAYRLLGSASHTMEDLLAHSNWTELALLKMGHSEVFCHVGDNVRVNSPNGQCPPLVTGTFGGADFLHSLLGEAGDKLSQASVTDLSEKMDKSTQDEESPLNTLREILGKVMSGDGEQKLNKGEEIKQQSKAYHFDPNNVAPPEVQKQLIDVLKWHDEVMRDIEKRMAMIPGLDDLMENLVNALNAYVYTLIAPWLSPILTQVISALGEGSKAVIAQDDQYAVFNDDNASDPSHSQLAKDHFGTILNEPAGQIAQIVVRHTVDVVVKAWFDDNQNIDEAINKILEAFHHPYYASGNSQIQQDMFAKMEQWFGSLPDSDDILQRLTKEGVKEHRNKRPGLEDHDEVEAGYGGHSHGAQPPRRTEQTHGGQQQSGYGQQQSSYGQQQSSYGQSHESGEYGQSESTGYGRHNESSYGQSGNYGRQNDESEHGSYGRQQHETSSYGQSESRGYGGNDNSYGRQHESNDRSSYGRHDEDNSYGRHEEQSSYGRQHESSRDESSYGRQHESGYNPSYGQSESTGYGHSESESRGGYNPSYNQSNRSNDNEYGRSSYGRSEENDDSSRGYSSHRNNDNESHGYGRSNNDETYGAERLNINDDNEYSGRRYGGGYDNN